MTAGPAALVLARAPGDPAALPGLALAPERAPALQGLLIGRAAAWAAAAAPGAASVAVLPRVGGDGDLAAVAALLPSGVDAFAAADLDAAIARVGRGPLLVAGTACPRLGAAHVAGALDDLGAGCDIVFGATLDGGWYLAGLREPRPELLSVTVLREGGIGAVLGLARELGAEVGLLRHERVLGTPGDAAALIADPLLDDALRAALSA